MITASLVFLSLLFVQQPDPYAARIQSEHDAQQAYQAKEYRKAADLFRKAVDEGDKRGATYYNLACSAALAGDTEAAFQALRDALAHGYDRTAWMSGDEDLKTLHADARWAPLVERYRKQEAERVKRMGDPNKAKLVTSNLKNFWEAYDEAQKHPAEERAGVYGRMYFDRGDEGMTDIALVRKFSPTSLAKAIDAKPKFFASLRPAEKMLQPEFKELRMRFRRLKQLYPPAKFPNVYFMMSPLAGGGTTSDNGLLIGTEFFMKSPQTPTEELSDWEKRVIGPPSDVVPLVVHESIHYQQNNGSATTALAKCLHEGAADFVATVVCDGEMMVRVKKLHEWGNAREAELWAEFQKDMDGSDTKRWLYGSGDNERPDDLGYYMGYKICEAYYNKAADKKQAVQEILNYKSAPEFLKASGYADKFAGQPLARLTARR